MTRGEFAARLEARAKELGLDIPTGADVLLAAYFEVLARWNSRINLTALPLNPPTDETLDRLFFEPLSAVQYVPEAEIVWFDLGSGGGSPALPIRIVRPSACLTMVEATAKKAAFLREAVRKLGLGGVVVANQRFEELGARQSADLVTARAVRPDAAMLTAAHLLLKPGGRLLLFSSGAAVVESALFRFDRSAPLPGSGRSFVYLLSSVPRGTQS